MDILRSGCILVVMKNSLRFNDSFVPRDTNGWNIQFMGLVQFLDFILRHFHGDPNLKMVEVGSYMGESTFMWGASGIFKSIDAIDPHSGGEEANDVLNVDWDYVKRNFYTNTRFFNNIRLINDFSHNVVDQYEDKSLDFVYIDASHEYKDVKKDIEIFLPKIAPGGLIGGHDHQPEWPGVVKAVSEVVGIPEVIFSDSSWVKIIN